MAERINVTRAILPRQETFANHVTDIFESRVLTNNGKQVLALEKALRSFLHAPQLLLCTNGTIALELCLHAVKAAGHPIITTPFTYVATASAALWIGCKVVFADIDPETLAIDPAQIAKRLTKETGAIIPVDIYGHPCDFKKIESAASGLPVIYDAAQAFGAAFKGKSLFNFGNYATCSLHATKALHTFEGGFVVCKTKEEYDKLVLLRAFGHRGDNHFSPGTNAKMSEIHAAMGLSLLGDFEAHLWQRKQLCELYDQLLNWQKLRKPAVPPGFSSNYAYYPVIFESEKILQKVMNKLAKKDIYPRRYFYPALTTLPYLKGQSCPIAEDIAKRVLCLPLYSGLADETAEKIADMVNKELA